jgi:protein-L-isoaspartate(D-aspartate) O-methyltransferase
MTRGQDDMMRRGIGMTSQRTRERLIQRLYEEGICNAKVLEVIRRTPRHLFVDEALAHRAYEDTALPIGHRRRCCRNWSNGSFPWNVSRCCKTGPRNAWSS